MITEENLRTMDAADRQALAVAVRLLERQSLASRLADMAGQPLSSFLKQLPPEANRKLQDVVSAAMLKSLKVAISTLDRNSGGTPSHWMPKLMTGISGGVSGFFGLAALAVELPITTTLMLRSIAEIARSEGEDLASARSKLACLEVFALGGRGIESGVEASYYTARALMAKAMSEAASFLLERGVVEESAPVLLRLVAEIASRFGIVVSEKVAAGAVPVIGALGGAAINVAFTDHFQGVAQGHFIIRRLERKYGGERVRSLYAAAVRI
jgi:hypothetical protein